MPQDPGLMFALGWLVGAGWATLFWIMLLRAAKQYRRHHYGEE
jgi:hypothetical protein